MKSVKLLAASLLAASLALSTMGAASAETGVTKDSLLESKPLYEIHTAAGTGEAGFRDGANAAFSEPTSLVYFAKEGTLLTADKRNQRLRSVGAKGTTTMAGLDIGMDDYNSPLGALNDGKLLEAAFNHPAGLAEDGSGALFIADAGNHAVRVIDGSGEVKTLAGNGLIGLKDGAGEEARFNNPLDLAVTKDQVVYVADTLNHVIRKIEGSKVTTLNAPSTRVVEVFPGVVENAGDFKDGPLYQAKFNEPSGLALDAKGNLYVSDTGNQRIRYIDFAKGTVTTVAGGAEDKPVAYGTSETFAGGGYADGSASKAKFNAPRGLALSPDGGLLIADSLNHVIRYLKDGRVTTVAGTPEETGKVDGIASAAQLNTPTDVVWMGDGAYGIADAGNNRVRILKPYTAPAGLSAGSAIHLLYNHQVLESDSAPDAVNGTTFVPVRILTEKLGFKVQYAKGKTVLTKGTVSYILEAGSKAILKKNEGQAGQTIHVEKAPFNKLNRLFLPVRFFAEEIGLDVQWLPEIGAVLLRDKVLTSVN
ncbi:NHL domain-containing protein [Paenibacillus mendelii]|uniref:Stalk domain-containing protein n=1 Tax=Paenibacillus mendelii TaxID=206163 RepID=A0ABV6JB63_9BACL|nr:stalk domain-containing protein [Paenibacillus mendelii]MCQ6563011.1 stalk domain-containing protein [Paenibacillus mendelii]